MKYILLFLSVTFAVLAQILLKKASFVTPYEKKWVFFISLSVLAYAITFIFQTYVFRFFELSKVGPFSAIVIMVLVFLSGALLFGEHINVREIVGVCLGLISIYLIMS
jgi:drug/metabolite transporter (DMT)-like permease